MTNRFRNAVRPAGRRFATLGLATALTFAVACSADQILEVEDIDVASPESVSDPAALPAVLAGALGDFANAYNGGGDFNQITLAGQLSDELYNTETFPTRIENDQRRQQYQSNGSLQGLFYATQQGRASADRAAEAYVRLEKETDVGLAEALNLSALSYILLAENYCSAVPISTMSADGATFEYGEALTTAELLEVAVRKADSALANATATGGAGSAAKRTEQARLARLVKARALLNLNRPADAVTAIGGETGVPTTFQYIYGHSETTGRQNNGTWGVTISVGRFGVPDGEGGNGLPFQSEGNTAGTVKDPRVANVRRGGTGRGFDNSTIQFMQQKYPARASAVIIADGVEARLIEAEAALRAGNANNALTILNALRANSALLTLRGYTGALPALTLAASQTAQEDQLFKERAYWLYLTSHRLGDLRRLVRQYNRSTESVFPTGSYHKSGTYGTDVNTPIPQAEDNNPAFDRAGCVSTQA